MSSNLRNIWNIWSLCLYSSNRMVCRCNSIGSKSIEGENRRICTLIKIREIFIPWFRVSSDIRCAISKKNVFSPNWFMLTDRAHAHTCVQCGNKFLERARYKFQLKLNYLFCGIKLAISEANKWTLNLFKIYYKAISCMNTEKNRKP